MQSTQPDVIGDLQRSLGDGGTNLFDVVPALLRSVISKRLWAERSDKNGDAFRSFEAFAGHKLWWGLESSIDDLLIYCRNAKDVQAMIKEEVAATGSNGGDRRSADAKQSRNTKVNNGESDTATYILRRLKRDDPQLAQQVISGSISANAAAVQAGIRKPTWTAPADPERLAAAIERRFPGWRLVKAA